jgi:hypothetical protein
MTALLGVSVAAIATAAAGLLATLVTWFRTRRVLIRAENETKQATANVLERGVEIDLLRGPQSRIDATETRALSTLIEALADVPEAVIQVGSVLLIKAADRVLARSLTVKELRYLEQHKDLLQSTSAILAAFDDPATPFSQHSSISGNIEQGQ